MLAGWLALCCWLPAAAQQPAARHRLSLSLGLNALARQDLIFSPFVHRNLSLRGAALGWERERNALGWLSLRYAGFAPQHRTPYSYWWNPGQQRYATGPHSFTFVELEGGWAHAWTRGSLTLRTGAAAGQLLQALYYANGPFSMFGYFAALGAGPWTGIEWRPARRCALDASLHWPLLSWTARSPYLVNDDAFIENTLSHHPVRTVLAFLADGALEGPHQLQLLTASGRLRFRLSEAWDLGAGCRLQLIRHAQPLPLRSVQQHLHLEAGYRFGA